MRVLALDIGSSSIKAAYWDGKRFGRRVRVGYETEFEGVKAELPAEVLKRALMKVGREVKAMRAEAVSFCTLSSGVVVTGAEGDVRVGVITHQDRRSVEDARRLVEKLGKAWLLKHTGNLPYPGGIGSSTLAWIARHARSAFKGKYQVGQLSSYVGKLLTGEWVIDPSQAVFLGLWDIRTNRWNERMCAAVYVDPGALPRCVWADEVVGKLDAAVARQWEVTAGIPVVGGFVDTSAAIVQTPMKPGQLTHNSGSTDVLAMCVREPKPEEGILTRPVGTKDGGWLAIRTIAAAGSALAWARREWFSEMGDAAWARTVSEACKPEAAPKEVSCFPEFSGDRASIHQATGAVFTGLSLATNRKQLLAAIVQGLVKESAANYAHLRNVHRPAEAVFSMGSVTELAGQMHRAWPGKHSFHRLAGDSMPGLVKVARKALEGKSE